LLEVEKREDMFDVRMAILRIASLCCKGAVKFGMMCSNGVRISSLAFLIIQLRSNSRSLLGKFTQKPLWRMKQTADSEWEADSDSTKKNLRRLLKSKSISLKKVMRMKIRLKKKL
jgi:hypothetical protein